MQRLIRAIEGALAASNKAVKVEMPKMLPDKITGEMREHDVVLTITSGHHQTLVALECRDRSRPVGVNPVEEFSKKCEATGIHSGVIVSSKGFSKTAITKAAFYNIGCFTLKEAESFNWCLAAGIVQYRRQITNTDITVFFPNDAQPPIDTLQDKNGTLINKNDQLGWGRRVVEHYDKLKQPGDFEPSGDYTRRGHDDDPEIYAILNGEKTKAKLVSITVSYKVTEEFKPFSFRTYKDVGRSKDVTQVAVASMDVGDGSFADMVLSTDDDGHIIVSVVRGGRHPKLPIREKKRAVG